MKNHPEKDKREHVDALIRENSHEAFEKIYDNYSAAVMGIIISIVKDKSTAEIVLYKTFIEMWQSRQLYSASKEPFFIWLIKIARFFALNQ